MDLLMEHPPTPLPKMKRRPIPPHPIYPASLATTRGTPEFTLAMEREEGERLDSARKDIIAETDKLRAKLIERENELERLKRELGAAEDP